MSHERKLTYAKESEVTERVDEVAKSKGWGRIE